MKKPLELINDAQLIHLARDFINTIFALDIMATEPKNNDITYEAYSEKIVQAINHPFYVAVNKLVGFHNARTAFFKKAFTWEKETIKFLQQNVCLEFFCANCILHICNPKLIVKASVPQTQIDSIRNLTIRLEHKLRTLDGFYFESNAKQHALKALLHDLLSSENETPYNTGQLHHLMMREAFAKYLLAQLLQYCNGLNLSHAFFADCIISIVPNFFRPSFGEMDRSDWIAHAKTIDQSWRTEENFLNKTFRQYLIEFSAKQV